jgi:poly(3-hydroxybutyrate) depolymerase
MSHKTLRSLAALSLLLVGTLSARGQETLRVPTVDPAVSCSDTRFVRPLSDVLTDLAARFHIRYKLMVDTTGLILPYADSRIRPYSVDESLRNVLSYFDFQYEKQGKNTYKLRAYDYPRRSDEEGAQLLDYLSSLYSDSATFDARRQLLKREFRQKVGFDALLERTVLRRDHLTTAPVRTGRERRHEGYRTQNFRMETLPGLYCSGTIYLPAASKEKHHPLIVCPNGHFADGRYNPDLQKRMATLARMGAIVVGWDLFGWGESEWQVGRPAHERALAQPLQLLNGWLIFDWMMQRRDVDPTRVAVNGGSGGGTHCVMLTLLDDRFTAACPVVSFCAHFDGGCPCESGMGTALCGGGTCNAEYAALFAPRPLGFVSDGGDWTRTYPTQEVPYLHRIYGFYGAEDRLYGYHFPDERHDFGPNKRTSVYDFFTRVFGLDASMIDEDKVDIESIETLQFHKSAEELPSGAIRSWEELCSRLGE